MGLPIQAAPTYRCVLPSDGREITFRPFLVKEQKVLILARESEDSKETLEAVKTLISNVTEGEVNANELPMVDMEYLFIKVRSVSVGEHSTINLNCSNGECRGTGEVVINLEEIVVEGEFPNDTVMISDNVGVVLKLIQVKDVDGMEEMHQADQMVEIVKRSIVRIFDEENVYEASETSDKDLNDFIENLSFKQLEILGGFFDSVPKLKKEVEFKCNLCESVQTRMLEGLSSFF
jgi:hypothetical protein